MKIYGKNVAEEITDMSKIKKAYLHKKFSDKNIIDKLLKNNIKIIYLEKDALDKLVNANHQGIILELKDYNYASLDEIIKEDIIVILDHLTDPHNLGAIIRTCEAAGIKSIIIPKDRSVSVTPAVIKVSTGAIFRTKIAVVNNLVNTIKLLKKEGYWIIGTDMIGEDFRNIDYKGKIVLIIGSEGSGMHRLVKENCDFIAKIPMMGQINSLNASVAAGLIIYEAVLNR